MKSLLLVGLLALPQAAPAQTAPPTPPAKAPTCDATEYRQFDFWVGDWVVHGGPDGDTLAGHNRIERSDDGCRLLEDWRGASGFAGQSLSAWDAAAGVWRQFWVGSDGLVLQLAGGLEDGAMVLRGESPRPEGSGMQQQRITWTPQDDGSVTQHWETSDDEGNSWSTSSLGIYRLEGKNAPPPANG